MPVLEKVTHRFNRWSMKYMPSALSIAIILTIIVILLAIALAGTSPLDCVKYWGDGFWALLTFGMQMCLIIFAGTMIACAPPVSRLLDRLSGVVKGPRSAVVFLALFAMILGCINWGVSIALSAIMVRKIARQVKGVDYPLLTICAYLGVACTFHAGFSASTPLLVATEGNFLQKDLGIAPIPVSETLFSTVNLVLLVMTIVVLSLLIYFIHPGAEKATTVDPKLLSEEDAFSPPPMPAERRPADYIEHTWVINGILGCFGIYWLGQYFYHKGLSLDLNVVNMAFVTLAFLLHRSPASVGHAAVEAGKTVHGIIIQFPLYAGIYGIINGSNLVGIIGDFFVRISTTDTYPLFVYWYSGILNYFVPSGGSKWAIEAPYILAAGDALGVSRADVIVSYGWGDMSTNIVQPFWAIPLLSIAKMEFKQILHYGMVIFIVYETMISLGWLIYPLLK